MYTAAAHEFIALSLFPVTGMALRWLLLGSSGSLDAGWDFFRGDTRERGARDEPTIGGATAIPMEI